MGRLTWTNETRKLSELVEWPDNPRQIQPSQSDRLNQSLAEFGQPETIAIGPDNEIYNGHQRLITWIAEHGPDLQVSVRVASRNLTEHEKQKLTVYLHQGTTGEWDFEKLANWDVGDLTDWGFSLDELKVGGIEPVIPDDPGAQVDKAAELQEKWQVERGQIWQVGKHKVMCGDSTVVEEVKQLVSTNTVWNLLTDPPYGIDAANMQMGVGKREFPRKGNWDTKRVDVYQFVKVALLSIVWGGNYYSDVLPVTADWLCWHKKNDNLSFSEFELAWSNVGKRARIIQHHWSGEEKQHITQKPLDVIKWCLQFFPIAELVFDPFLGSGTTLVACEQTNRIGYGMEIEPKYVSVTLERLSGMGLEPKLVNHE